MNNGQDKLEHLKKGAKPFFFEGSNVGVLLTHGLTASPTEMLSLGKFIHKNGFSVHGVCLAGHGSNYRDLPQYSYLDWINSCTEGLKLLKKKCEAIIP
ncbi:MAG: alpha/beta hydrolase, partial [Candidatus Hodarchaeales archaeon]